MSIVRGPDASGWIRCHRDWGPSFGTEEYYHLQIWQDGMNSYFDHLYGFKCPANTDKKKYFPGKSSIYIDEMEVFQVSI